MRKFILPLIAILAATPALAGDMTPAVTGGHIYTADEPFVAPAEQARRNKASVRQSWDAFVSEGGCDGIVAAFEYTITCMHGVFGGIPNEQMGSDGGE